MKSLVQAGVDCAPKAVGKADLPLGEFVRRPELFRDFLHAQMPEQPAKANSAAV
jgi:hypothetical protein